MKIKNLKNTIIPLLIISSVFLIAPFGISSEPGTMPNGAVYSWEETRHTVKKITIWNSESIITNSTSEYDYDFNYTYTYDYYFKCKLECVSCRRLLW